MNVHCRVCGAATDALLCRDHAGELERALGDLPGLLDALTDRVTRDTRVYRATRLIPWQDEELAQLEAEYAAAMALLPVMKRSRDARVTLPATMLPVDVDASRLLAEAAKEIGATARDLAERQGFGVPAIHVPRVVVEDVHVSVIRNRWRIVREPRIVREAATRPVSILTAWLLTNLDTIRLDESAGEIHRALTRLASTIAHAVDRSPSAIYAGPCTRCGVDMWRQPAAAEIRCDARYHALADDGESLVTIAGCGQRYTLNERKQWLLAAVAEELVSLDQLRDFLRSLDWPWPPATTVSSWRHRRQLLVRSVDRHGVELFRGGDVIELVDEWLTKQATRAC